MAENLWDCPVGVSVKLGFRGDRKLRVLSDRVSVVRPWPGVHNSIKIGGGGGGGMECNPGGGGYLLGRFSKACITVLLVWIHFSLDSVF